MLSPFRHRWKIALAPAGRAQFSMLLLLIAAVVSGQSSDTLAEKEIVNIDHADELRMLDRGTRQKLTGAVELSQDSIFMYADSAELINDVQLFAEGNVVMQQGDSLAGFSRELDYNAETRLAQLRGAVVLKRGDTELYTNRLDYDLATKLATYHTGGRVTNRGTELTSTHGYYYADTKNVYFRDSVVAIDERFEMRADTLRYDLAAERVYFLGPTVIRSDTHRIYTESGYYDVALDQAVFNQNAQYLSGERRAAADTIKYFGDREVYVLSGDAYVAEGEFQRAVADKIDYFRAADRYVLTGNATVVDSAQTVTGDTIDYDAAAETYAVSGGRPRVLRDDTELTADRMFRDTATELSYATGNVVYRDTAGGLTINADAAQYDQTSGYFRAYDGPLGRPLMTVELDGDTMFLAADTLTSVGDSARQLSAFRDVRILKSDLQAIADSLSFQTTDSVLTLYNDPVLWQDSSQLSADTIDLFLVNEQPDRVLLRRNAMVLTTPDFVFFNQVKGNVIEAFFRDNSLVRTEVNGNAEAIYYAQDEAGDYIGVNKTACSRMVLYFDSGSVNRIKFLSNPTGRLDPMGAVDHSALQLEGFRWRQAEKPLLLGDLFSPASR